MQGLLARALLLFWVAVPAAARGQDRVTRLLDRAAGATARGEHGHAVTYLKLALRLDPGRAGTRADLARALVGLGVALLPRSPVRARRAFREGTRWDPGNAGAWAGLGETSRRLGALDAAEEAYRRVVALRPADFGALLELGRIAFEQRRYDEARGFLARALERRPGDRDAARLLRKAVRDGAVERPFKDFRGEHYLVRFHGGREGLEKLVPDILAFLERTWEGLAKTLGHRPQGKIVVLLYTDTEFRKLDRTADWIQAYYDGRVRVPLDSWSAQKNRVQRTIRHELAHAFVHSIAARVSPWLQEGFAQWFEGVRVDRARDRFRRAPLATSDRLRRPFTEVEDTAAVARLYAASLVLFAHLRDTRGIEGFHRLLAGLSKQEGGYARREDRALRAIYGKDLDGLIRDVAARHHLVAPAH